MTWHQTHPSKKRRPMGMGCQKASPRKIHAQLGKIGAGQATNANQQTVDQAVATDKSVACVDGFQKSYDDLMAKNSEANKILATNSGKDLDAATKADLTKRSADLSAATDTLIADMIKQSASSCTIDSKSFYLIDIKNKIDQTIITTADAIKAEDAISKKAREEKAKLDLIRLKNSLVGQFFQVSKELAEVLDKSHLAGEAHFTQGIVGLGQTDYKLLLNDKSKTVCQITEASEQKVAADTKLTILNVSLDVNEQADSADATVVSKTSILTVKLSAKDQLFGLSCRLTENMQSSTKEHEFKNAFNDLIKF